MSHRYVVSRGSDPSSIFFRLAGPSSIIAVITGIFDAVAPIPVIPSSLSTSISEGPVPLEYLFMTFTSVIFIKLSFQDDLNIGYIYGLVKGILSKKNIAKL